MPPIAIGMYTNLARLKRIHSKILVVDFKPNNTTVRGYNSLFVFFFCGEGEQHFVPKFNLDTLHLTTQMYNISFCICKKCHTIMMITLI